MVQCSQADRILFTGSRGENKATVKANAPFLVFFRVAQNFRPKDASKLTTCVQSLLLHLMRGLISNNACSTHTHARYDTSGA